MKRDYMLVPIHDPWRYVIQLYCTPDVGPVFDRDHSRSGKEPLGSGHQPEAITATPSSSKTTLLFANKNETPMQTRRLTSLRTWWRWTATSGVASGHCYLPCFWHVWTAWDDVAAAAARAPLGLMPWCSFGHWGLGAPHNLPNSFIHLFIFPDKPIYQ